MAKKEPARIIIPQRLMDSMHAHVEMESPLEACGMVGGETVGTDIQAQECFSARNELSSPYRYRMDPRDQLRIFKDLESKDLDLVAIYHSHPQGPPLPSMTDIDQAYYPEAVYLIWYLNRGVWNCRGFFIEDKTAREIPIGIV